MSNVAVDIGGTFTDVVLQTSTGKILTAKSFSTPENYSIGIMNALQKLDINLNDIDLFIHGTTIALNTLLQRNGAKTGLITTKGFRDTLEIMRTNRPDMYNLQQIKPEPLVPRFLRREVSERIDAKGNVIEELDEQMLIREVEELIKLGVTSIAVCYINSYINPVHEKITKKIIQSSFPQLSITISSEIIQEWREFERTSTTVINAYCKPVIQKYATHLSESLKQKGLSAPIQYMQSNGGLMSSEEFVNGPVKSLLSGPVGGVTAGEYISNLLGVSNLITLDIGGTSADISIVHQSQATYSREREINRLPVLFPSVDVYTIGSGGGSIAWIDKGRSLQVGPQSAGAYPGPICYDNGGDKTTVTDANLLLGYIDENYFLGGEIKLNKEKAYALTEEYLAKKLGLPVLQVAYGIIQIINSKMSRVLKEVTINKGFNPKDFSLLAYGGGGGLHAVELARELGIPKVIIPVHSSVFSAFGMLCADMKYDITRTYVIALDDINIENFNSILEEMVKTGHKKLNQSLGSEIDEYLVQFTCSLQMRYKGQDHTIEIPLHANKINAESISELKRLFIYKHKSFYGYELEDQIMITNLKVTALINGPKIDLVEIDKRSIDEAKKGTRNIYLPSIKQMGSVHVYERKLLGREAEIFGPAIIEDVQSTIILFEKDKANVDEYGNIIIRIGGHSN